MDKSKTSLTKWFWAIYLMSEDKRGVSALSLKSKIGAAYYIAWTMKQKICKAMSERDGNYKMDGIAEMDEAFFGAPGESGKRGRGTEKAAVLVSVSLAETGKPKFAKMEVIECVSSKTVVNFTEKTVVKGSEIHTDGLNVYTPLSENGYKLQQKKYDPKNQQERLHWTHILISNAKACIEGTYHGLDKPHLQRYLNEFCHRFNRRSFKAGNFHAFFPLAPIRARFVTMSCLDSHKLLSTAIQTKSFAWRKQRVPYTISSCSGKAKHTRLILFPCLPIKVIKGLTCRTQTA
jgi:transposase-like protein